MDREKVIKGLECCTKGDACFSDCPYFKEFPMTDGRCITALQADTFALLKEPEAVKPYMDYDGHDVWRCGKCGTTIFHIYQNESDEDWKSYAKFCRHCGLKVKWE